MSFSTKAFAVLCMGYMDLMSKVDNIKLLCGVIKHWATNRGKLDTVFDLEDGFRDTIWMKKLYRKITRTS
jgi:ubiquinone biosynthesis protein COQ4